jgi:excisionase family DNA binding protein
MTEAAKRLGVHQNTLRQWTDKGIVKAVMLPSGHRRYQQQEIERMRREMGFDSPSAVDGSVDDGGSEG